MFKKNNKCLLILLLCCSFSIYSQNKLVISSIDQAGPAVTVIPILTEAYSRIGVEVEFQHLPAMRAIEHSNHGTTDGEAFRVSAIEKEYPNLVRVNVPVQSTDMFVYTTKGKSFNLDGWESIPPGYVVGYKRGIKFVEYAVKQYNINAKTTLNVDQLMKSLDAGRNDIVIAGAKEASDALKALNLDNIIRIETPIHTSELYHYLNVKHSGLVKEIEKVLMDMQANGDMDRIRSSIMNN